MNNSLHETGRFDLADIFCVAFFSSRTYNFVAARLFGVGSLKFVLLAFSALALCALSTALVRGRAHRGSLILNLGFLMVAALCLSLWRNPGLEYWTWASQWSLLQFVVDVRKGLWALVAIGACRSKEALWRNLKIAAWINGLYLALQTGLFFVNGDWRAFYNTYTSFQLYNMAYGYELWLSASVFAATFLWENRWAYFPLAAVTSAFSLFYGSRGVIIAQLCFFVLWGLYFILLRRGASPLRSGLRLASLVLAAALCVTAIAPVTAWVSSRGSQVEAPSETLKPGDLPVGQVEESVPAVALSRTVSSLISGDLTQSNGRRNIAKLSLQAIKAHPLLGSGLFADRAFVGLDYEWGYSHNVFLEVASHFGLVGVALLVAMGIVVLRRLRKDDDLTALLLVLVCSSASKLLVSDSYLFLSWFWALVALVLWDVKFKRPWMVTGCCCLLALVALVLYLPVEKKRLTARQVTFDEPTALVLIGGHDIKKNQALVKYLANRGHQATAFLSMAHLSNAFKEELPMLAQTGWSFQDGGYSYASPRRQKSTQFREDLEATNQAFEALKLPAPQGYLPPYGTWSDVQVWRVGQKRDFVVDYTRDISQFKPYASLGLPESKCLLAYQLSGQDFDEPGALKTLLARGQGGKLLPLYLDPGKVKLAQADRLYAGLKAMGYKTMTLSELEAQFRSEAGTATWQEWLRNSYLVSALKGLI